MAIADPYLPIQVGKSLTQIDLGIQGDNSGDNISNKNTSYCELTGIYWAWKNLKNTDYIGLSHYRRYFDFHNKIHHLKNIKVIPSKQFQILNLTVPDINTLFSKHDIILAKPNIYPYSIRIDYCCSHLSKDISIIESIVGEVYPEYLNSFKEKIYRNNTLSHYNMFIMKWSSFEKYCTWLFNILKIAEERIDITTYDSTQKRIWGYVAERLLNVYVQKEKMKIKYLPIYLVTDGRKDISILRYCALHLRNNLSFFFQRKWF
jgi:hypothetical protein